ncbi:PREDICTED: vasorin-like [Cyprinodon variegatus]|uniref:Vasorin a n=1 Tax=Cyprinodon variegatus TaxID=28743 RepID=A0A3Q2CHM3_CYPVA|nr:PREDICTED: vasorin-like [Cyprinodon variegatus]
MFLHIAFFLLSCEAVFSSDCPEICDCKSPSTIFCVQSGATSVPRVPISTENLYIFQNDIITLTRDDFKDITELKSIDLSQNKLTEIPDNAFESLSKLNNLDLSANHITHISKESFSGLVQLERLYLHGNLIQSIHPEAFEGLEMLLELKLQENKLTSLPSIDFPRLLLIDLSNNKIPTLESPNFHTPHLETLKLSSLGLSSLDEALVASMRNLHELDLSSNKLQEVPQALKQESLKGLTKLSLAANPLFEVKVSDLKQLVAIQELDLSGINLQGFPEGFFENFPKLTKLTIAENPFNCLCPLAWFPVWLKEKKHIMMMRPEETRCHFPLVNAGKKLSALEHKDFGCPLTTTESIGYPLENTHVPQIPTTSSETTYTNAIPPPPPPSDESLSFVTDNPRFGSEPPVSPSFPGLENELHFCPQNICLNGGTCYFDLSGTITCLCSSGTSGLYCETVREKTEFLQPSATEVSVVTSVLAYKLDEISSREVTSTSILLDLHSFIETRPNIRGIRLTYRNLSGPDRRPMILSLPTSYPEYTLRGLRPNCTYLVCASPLGEKIRFKGNSSVEMGPCTEARTSPTVSVEPLVNPETPMTKTLIAALVVLALVLLLAAVAGAIVCVQKKRQATAGLELELGPTDPEAMDFEEVKVCMENGVHAKLPIKQPQGDRCQTPQPPPLLQQNGSLEHEAPLIQGHYPSNNNISTVKPSYF